jgi:TonB-dependent receptor
MGHGGLAGVSALAIAWALAASAQAQTPPAAATDEVDAVIVTGIRASLRSAQAIKRTSNEVVDSIVAQDIGKLPDPNLADSLQRIPGVQIYRYAGEGLFPVIRGLQNQNRTEYNGRSIYTPDVQNGGGRDMGTDNALPELVAGIDVYKNPSAERVEGAIGGLVNIRTRHPFDFKGAFAQVSAKANYFDMAKKTEPTYFGLLSNRWDTPVGEFGALLALAKQKTAMRQDQVSAQTNNYPVRPYLSYGLDLDGDGTVNTAASPSADVGDYVSAPNNFWEQAIWGGRERKGYDLALQWKPKDDLEFYIDNQYVEYTYRQNSYDIIGGLAAAGSPISGLVTAPRKTYVTAADVAANPALKLGDLVGGFDFVKGVFSNVPITTSGGTSVDHPVAKILAAGGKWRVSDALKVSGEVSKTTSDQEKFSSTLSFRAKAGYTVTDDLSGGHHRVTVANAAALRDPASYEFTTFEYAQALNTIDETVARIDAEYRFDLGPISGLKVGARVTDLDYRTDSSGNGMGLYNLRNSTGGFISVDAVDAEVYTRAFNENFRGDNFVPTGFITSNPYVSDQSALISAFPNAYLQANSTVRGIQNRLPDFYSLNRFEVGEKTKAVYAMANLDFAVASVPVTGDIGVRVVRTEGVSTAYGLDGVHAATPGLQYQYATPNSGGYDYSDVLPTLNLKAYLRENLILRFGASKGVTRPPFGNMKPLVTSALNKSGYVPGSLLVLTAGNPNLKPQRATSYDVALEWYFSATGYAYLNVFKKDLKGFVVTLAQYEDLGLTDTNGAKFLPLVQRPQNGAGGEIKGFEAGFQTFFDFLPSPWNGLGVQASYILVDSTQQVPFGATNPVLIDTNFQNLSKNSANLVGMYEKGKFTARLAYTWRDDYMRSSFGGGTPNYPLITPAYGTLDGSVSYDVNDHFSITAEAGNITGSVPDRLSNGWASRPSILYAYDRRYSLALRYKFGG